MSLTGRTPIIDKSRIWLAGIVALVVSLVVNLLLRTVALALFEISPDFMNLATPVPVILFTTVGMIGATVVYFILARRGGQVVTAFRRLAIIVLILSFLPDIALLATGQPGASLPAVLTLMVMHVTTAVIAVGVLTRMTVRG